MVTRIKKFKVYMKHKFLDAADVIAYNIVSVLISSLVIMLVFGLLNYNYTLRNYISCLALYFVWEEVKPFILKMKRK